MIERNDVSCIIPLIKIYLCTQATFVSQYRRVSYSLESLKEQLLLYSEALKQQLFVIINRDYKDFITITTKVTIEVSCPFPNRTATDLNHSTP